MEVWCRKNEYLVERWISGSDGKFTEEEAEKAGDSGRLEGRGLEAASDFSDCLWSLLFGGIFGTGRLSPHGT